MRESAISVWRAADKADLAAHYAIRHDVFVNEQGVLLFTDVDRWDDQPGVVHVLAARGPHCAGSVRLYPLDGDGRWKGDRLAVLKNHRKTVIGAQLVRFATATAAARGGEVMEASVQLANVAFFQRLGWVSDGAERTFFGLLHQPMLFDLSTAPPLDWPGRPDVLVTGALQENGGEAICPAA